MNFAILFANSRIRKELPDRELLVGEYIIIISANCCITAIMAQVRESTHGNYCVRLINYEILKS